MVGMIKTEEKRKHSMSLHFMPLSFISYILFSSYLSYLLSRMHEVYKHFIGAVDLGKYFVHSFSDVLSY